VAIDVTRQREAEKQAEILQRVVDTLPIGVAILDPRALILSVNPAFTRISGFTRDQTVGRSLPALISKFHDAECLKHLMEMLNSDQTWCGPIQLQGQDDDPIQAIAVMAPFADQHGSITHFILLLEENRRRQQSKSGMESVLIDT
jgi:phosphoserine phosphatase RsbU/P